MKKTVLNIFLFASIASLSAVSCGTNESKNETTEVSESDSLAVEMQYAELIDLDQKLFKTDMTIDKGIAQQLYNRSKDFIVNHPDNYRLEEVTELSAKGAEGLGKKDEAIEILHKMFHDFGTSDKVVVYMYNKARILESMPGKENNARAAYEELILKFPESDLAKDTRVYLDTYFGKSDEEIIQMLESNQALADTIAG